MGGGTLLNDLAARRHLGKVSRAGGRTGRAPSGDHGAGEEGLVEMKLAFGEGVAGNERQIRRDHAPWKQPGERFDEAGTEAEGGQVVLVIAGVGRRGDG